jgi:peptidoglycan hydrolase-like protein with peptidoglycan-binding domain
MRLPLGLLFVGLAVPAFAENRALIIANENYRSASDITAADDAMGARGALEAAGFRVVTGADLAAADQRAALGQMLVNQTGVERLVLLLTGHFVKSDRQSWFLGVDAARPNLATVGGAGLALDTVLEIAAAAPGGAVVLLGTEAQRVALGAGLQPGIGALDIPQGVSVISGDAAAIAAFAAEVLPVPGQSLKAKLAAHSELLAQGFLSDLVPFLPLAAEPGSETGVTPDPSAVERAFWEATRELGSPEAYDAYLARYPRGLYAAEAAAEAARIRAEPGRVARLAEEALGLSRDQRREVQRNLTLLEFDPNGIDGVFGRGTRSALTNWQRANAFEPTGYLTLAQVNELARQAGIRAAQLAEEARVRQAEQERLDQQYWNQTGAAGDEAGLRAYLRRYPDGLFAELAQQRLDAIEAERQRTAAAADRAAWNRARTENTVYGYEGYVAAMPHGAFVEEARRRIEALKAEANGADERAEAEAREAALNLPQLARSLVEVQLGTLGLNPGPADGTFDAATRRAIRRFQQSRGLPVTGYLDQSTLVQLLGSGVFSFGN